MLCEFPTCQIHVGAAESDPNLLSSSSSEPEQTMSSVFCTGRENMYFVKLSELPLNMSWSPGFGPLLAYCQKVWKLIVLVQRLDHKWRFLNRLTSNPQEVDWDWNPSEQSRVDCCCQRQPTVVACAFRPPAGCSVEHYHLGSAHRKRRDWTDLNYLDSSTCGCCMY